MKLKVMAYNIEDSINVTWKCLKIQDDLLEYEEEEMDHRKVQSNMDVDLGWNYFTKHPTIIMPMEKKECMV